MRGRGPGVRAARRDRRGRPPEQRRRALRRAYGRGAAASRLSGAPPRQRDAGAAARPARRPAGTGANSGPVSVRARARAASQRSARRSPRSARAGETRPGDCSPGVCSEGSSTHERLDGALRVARPASRRRVLTVGTRNQISLGNRGRVDVVVEIHGEPTHSSVADEVGRATRFPWLRRCSGASTRSSCHPSTHPQLGGRSILPYKLTCGPIAPHTIPAWCLLVFDRRLLPGDEPEQAVAEVAGGPGGARGHGTPRRDDAAGARRRGCDGRDRASRRGAEQNPPLGRRLETFYPALDLRRRLRVRPRCAGGDVRAALGRAQHDRCAATTSSLSTSSWTRPRSTPGRSPHANPRREAEAGLP